MSSPFQKSFSAKSPMSPLNGAYTSGAGGRVTISDAPHFAKLQSDLVGAVDKAYAKNSNPCDDPNTVQYTKDSVLKKCPKKTTPSESDNTPGTNKLNKLIDKNKTKNNSTPSNSDSAGSGKITGPSMFPGFE
tara:strand:+ start:128 stop:523 length:396 start_codon:yes stop_codon:yes gene_type:complete